MTTSRPARLIKHRILDLIEPLFDLHLVHFYRLALLLAGLGGGVAAGLGMWAAAIVAMLGAVLAQLLVLERKGGSHDP
ncbi:MAG: hypothetical protein DCC55_34960 [Chloroflexi bacterium]|nr:MAG: hypothetical protein DCC55_34960 [Chloroflexota bacterium]